MEFLKNPNFDFLGKTRLFVAASLLAILGGLAYMIATNTYIGRDPKGYGVEFSGGTQLIARFQNTPEVDRIRAAVEPAAPGSVIQTYDDPAKNQILIRIAGVEDEAAPAPAAPGEETGLGAASERVKRALASAYPENPVVESSS